MTLPAAERPHLPSYFISGCTGTFGNAFTRYLLDNKLSNRVVCFSRDEVKQSQMAERFKHDSRLRFMLGDVRDIDRLEEAIDGCQIVVHAAALKRVDAIAYNSQEAQKTNVQGTANVCRASITVGVGKVITISSDKAVHPANFYGTTKQMAEHLTVGANVRGVPRGTRLGCVRYGNVLGSRGSVVGIFRQQAATGAPLTLTHPEMSRFWITVSQACELVMTALSELQGGEVFLPKLPTMRLVDLAEAVAPGHPHRFMGLRPGGEKLHERLISDEESSRTFDRGTHYVVAPSPHPWTAEEWSGTLVPDGWKYESSDRSNELTVPELQKLLEAVP